MMMMMVVRIVFEQEGADEIDAEPKRGDRDRFVKVNSQWREQPMHRFRRHRQSDNGKDDCARVAAENTDLSRPKAELWIVHVAACEVICDCRHHERDGMRAHVPAVGKEGHRVREHSSRDLQHHHRDGDANDETRAKFSPREIVHEIV